MLGEPPLLPINRLRLSSPQRKEVSRNREHLLERGRAQASKNQSGGRQKASVIEPGSNPVHTRSSGNEKGRSTQQHALHRSAKRRHLVMSSTYTAPIVHADIKAFATERLHNAYGGAA